MYDAAKEVIAQAGTDIETVKDEGKAKITNIATSGLELAQDALEQAPEVLEPVVAPIKKIVSEQLEDISDIGIEDYDSLNVAAVTKLVRSMDLVQLDKVERYEEAHKNRKTVLKAITSQRK